MDASYPVLPFNQFGRDDNSDQLLLFAPKAKDLAAWAGIPRKGWRIRMLFQRWVTQGRERELKHFWETAVKDDLHGPSAIVIALQDEPRIVDGALQLEYISPIDDVTAPEKRLEILAKAIAPRIEKRLQKQDLDVLKAFESSPLRDLPPIGHDYVFEFALQLVQMRTDPDWFIETNRIAVSELPGLITSMEALVRPALVVDGQHRLWGAQAVDRDIYLPVVAFTNADWMQQIYQFVVINEKAQKVDSEMLNDIFASSLTPSEQEHMRQRFANVRVDIEERIAGVLAGRDDRSPFFEMVRLSLPDPPEAERDAYISQTIIQSLIEGGRGAHGWRSDDAFYRHYIRPTFPNRTDWDDWREGAWKNYWFAFWTEVRDFYRPLAKTVRGKEFEIWDKSVQTNLTKGVGLKMFQRFFMDRAIAWTTEATGAREVLEEHLGKKKAREAVEESIRKHALPLEIEDFREQVRERILDKFPVRFFTAKWEASLDDSTGHERLLFQMKDAFERDSWRASGGGVFVAGD